MRYSRLLAVVSFLSLLSFYPLSICSADDVASKWEKTNWVPVFQGIDTATGHTDVPRLMRVCAMRIDTKTEGIKFYSTPRAAEGFIDNEKETVRETVPQFLEKNGLQAAINANFYHPFNKETMKTPGPSILLGLAVSEGNIVSKNEKDWPAFLVFRDNKTEIVDVNDDSDPPSDVETAVAGISRLLDNGVVPPQADEEIHPRTAVGISKDGRFVYFIVIDGRQEGYSDGATRFETGQWLALYGAWNGVNLDGGGSTTMVIRDHDDKAKVLNSPVGQSNVQGTFRYNGNNIGVRAKTLAP